MFSRKNSSTRTRSTPSRTRQKSNTKKKHSKNNSNITYTIPDVYTFLSHSCNFINKFKSSFNNEKRIGRKTVPKNCILITYGDIGNSNLNHDKNFLTFIEMFKSGHKYFKEPLKYEKKLKEIFGKKLHFHYSDYYGKKPPNSKKKFYADINYGNHMLFNQLTDKSLNDIIVNFNSLVKLNREDDDTKLSIRSKEEVEMHIDILNFWLSYFNIDRDEIIDFIDKNDKDGYIEFVKQSVLPYTLFKTGLYKLKKDLIVTDKAKYYLKSSEIKNMFKDSLIKTKFNFNDSKYNNIPISNLLPELKHYPINIKQSELFKSHPGIYYNFTCRVPCNSATPLEDIQIQRQFSNAIQNNNTKIPKFPPVPGIIASTRPTSHKIPSPYNRIINEMNSINK